MSVFRETQARLLLLEFGLLPSSLIDALGEKLIDCKPSARFVLVSRGFFGSPLFNCVEELEYTNAWNTQSICYVYQLKAECAVAAKREAARVELQIMLWQRGIRPKTASGHAEIHSYHRLFVGHRA